MKVPPLDWLGLDNAKLDLKLRWQDSSVTDPVTGNTRILSGQGGQNAYRTLTNRNKNNKYFIGLNYRQDFEQARVAWGWAVAERAERPLYKVNEFESLTEDIAVDAFIETTRWWGIKMRIQGENILNFADVRQRRKFIGERDLSPLATTELRDQTRGARLSITLSGNF